MFNWIIRRRFRQMVAKRLDTLIAKVRTSGEDFAVDGIEIKVTGTVYFGTHRVKLTSLYKIEPNTEMKIYASLPQLEIAVDAWLASHIMGKQSEIEIMKQALRAEQSSPKAELLRAVDQQP